MTCEGNFANNYNGTPIIRGWDHLFMPLPFHVTILQYSKVIQGSVNYGKVVSEMVLYVHNWGRGSTSVGQNHPEKKKPHTRTHARAHTHTHTH
jgi:hypothetical protein